MRYRLGYLPLFWSDLNEAATYVSTTLGNPAAARHLVDEAERGILSHLENPTFGRVWRGSRERGRTHYWFPVGNYMVFYVVDGDVMEVRRFLYGARDIDSLGL